MKVLPAFCLVLAAAAAIAADKPAAPGTVKGTVLEVKDAGSYTYLRLKTAAGEKWAAVEKTAVNKADKVTIENVMVMNNFESKALNKTFPTLILGNLAGGAGMPATAAGHGHSAAPADIGDVRVAKATGADARTVAEIAGGGGELKDKSVVVRAKVVKFNAQIMGKNWVHLRDGTGSADKHTDDLLVTTQDQAAVGDIVTARGVVRLDKDFGSGYAYKVLVEEAKLQR